MRKLLLALALVLLVSACGGSGDATAPSTTGSSAEPVTTVADSDGGDAMVEATESTAATVAESSTTDAAETATVAGPPAPEFVLTLDGGTTFALAGAEKPVYMVFWAEW